MEERVVGVDELAEADEVFCTGTAVGVAPVGTITYRDTRFYNIQNQLISSSSSTIIVSFNYWNVRFYACLYRMEYRTGSGTICQKLSSTLTGIQSGLIEDSKGWVHEIWICLYIKCCTSLSKKSVARESIAQQSLSLYHVTINENMLLAISRIKWNEVNLNKIKLIRVASTRDTFLKGYSVTIDKLECESCSTSQD